MPTGLHVITENPIWHKSLVATSGDVDNAGRIVTTKCDSCWLSTGLIYMADKI
jgi:hypothetical protein